MGAARHVGRVGGLAVALGVGAAIFVGHGVASAETDAEGSASTSTASTSTSASDGASSSSGGTIGSEPGSPGGPAATAASSLGGRSATGDKEPTGDPSHTNSNDDGPTIKPGQVIATGGANISVRSALEAKSGGGVTIKTSTNRRGSVALDGDGEGAATTSDDDPGAPAQFIGAESSSGPTPSSVVDDGRANANRPDPIRPPSGSANAMLAAAARRETSTDATMDVLTPTVVNGVITGSVAVTPPAYYTVVDAPVNGGKVTLDGKTGAYTFLPDASQLTVDGADQFEVLISVKSSIVQLLEQFPIVKDFVRPIVVRLQQIPLAGPLLSPLIGSAHIAPVDVPVSQLAAGQPIAFTTMVTSFDGTKISVNYFPKVGLSAGDKAPTILNGPSLATAGYTDPTQQTTVFGLVPGLAMLRANYNVVTWDPRGEFASGGRLHLDSENFEAKDVQEIIDWVTAQPGTQFETSHPDDPLIGMVGGSYGGGIQLTSAGIDTRIDAISPGIAWNDLTATLYPHDAFKTSWASLLLLSLVASGSRLDPEIYAGILTGAILGRLTEQQQEFLSGNSPDTVASAITIPTLFLQGTVDTLFPLKQAMLNAEAIAKPGVPMKMIWYCGGHGQCLDPVDLDQQTIYTTSQIMAWMDRYVIQKETPPLPSSEDAFTWIDQDGNWWGSPYLPTDDDFYGTAYEISGSASKLLPIVPVFGGSGPQWQATFPVSLVSGAVVNHGALNLSVPNPTPDATTHYVGAPKVQITYSGLGTSRNLYAQLVDNRTGRVLGNIVSPIPVILDGAQHTTGPIDMEAIAYTMDPAGPNDPDDHGDSLTLQIFDSATSFENFTAFGVVNVTSVSLQLPTAADVDQLEMEDAVVGAR